MYKFRNSKRKDISSCLDFGPWSSDIYLDFGACNLEFEVKGGAYDLSTF